MGGNTKNQPQHYHARQRFSEKHGMNVSVAECNQIVDMIESGSVDDLGRRAQWVRPGQRSEGNPPQLWWVPFGDDYLPIVYSSWNKTLVTVLTGDEMIRDCDRSRISSLRDVFAAASMALTEEDVLALEFKIREDLMIEMGKSTPEGIFERDCTWGEYSFSVMFARSIGGIVNVKTSGACVQKGDRARARKGNERLLKGLSSYLNPVVQQTGFLDRLSQTAGRLVNVSCVNRIKREICLGHAKQVGVGRKKRQIFYETQSLKRQDGSSVVILFDHEKECIMGAFDKVPLRAVRHPLAVNRDKKNRTGGRRSEHRSSAKPIKNRRYEY